MPLIAMSLAATLAMLSTFSFSSSLAASIGKQNGIRLVHGFTENEGIVEVQQVEMVKDVAVGVAWGTVCAPSPTSEDIGKVVCRQLGYDTFGDFPLVSKFTSLDSSRVTLQVNSCKGDEQRLESCNTEAFPPRTTCGNLAVLCANNGTVRFNSTPPSAAHSGVIEAFIEEEWQTVCPDRASSDSYLCSQLGYSSAIQSSMTIPPSGDNLYTPNWTDNDSRCGLEMYGAEGCVWYQKVGVCNSETNLNITCSGPPEKVAQPKVSVISSTSVEVSWPSLAGRNSAVNHYNIFYWKTEGDRNDANNFRMETVSADGSLMTKITNLESNTEYSIEIAGVSQSMGPGEFSDPVTFRTHIELKKPPKLTKLQAIPQLDGSVSITYEQPDNDKKIKQVETRFWTVAGYEAGSNGWFVSTHYSKDQNFVVLQGLLPSTNYTAKLRALSKISGVRSVGENTVINFTTPADDTQFNPAPTALSAIRISTSLVELSWTHIASSYFRWSCASTSEQFIVEGVYKGESSTGRRRRSNHLPSVVPIPGEETQYSVKVSLVNLEFNCTVTAEDKNGVRTSEHSPAQRVKPLITTPPSVVNIKTHVEGSTVFIDWETDDTSPRQRRQSAQQTVEPLALSVNCSFEDVGEVRSFFWWSPNVGNNLTMESLPPGANGTCEAILYTIDGPGQVYTFPVSIGPLPVEESLTLFPPLVSGKNVAVKWELPHDIVPSQTTVIVWEANDLTTPATQDILEDSSDTTRTLELSFGVDYVYMVMVDVRGGGRLQSNPVRVHVPNVIAAPQSPFGMVDEENGTSLSVSWTSVPGAAGYIVMATSYIGTLRNETLTKVVIDPTVPLRTVIPFEIECASKFTFKVAAFNSLEIGPYSEEVEVGTQHDSCKTAVVVDATQDQVLVYALLGLLLATVVALVIAGITIFCLLQRSCAQKRNRKIMIADGPLSSRSRRSSSSSIRYIGVHRVVKEEEVEEGEKEKELKSRPLPIPTESDLEDEEEEEEVRANNNSRLSFNASPVKVSPIEKEAGYSTIPGDVREEIIQAAHRTSVDHLMEQGYEMVHPSSGRYQSPRSLSTPSPNFYNVPRGTSPVGDYEMPVLSRSQSPAAVQGRSVRTQSAPHPLTYDVPPSRVTPGEVNPGQSGDPSASNHLYSNMSDTYDVPRGSVSKPQLISAGSGVEVPATYDVPPPRGSLTGNETYDVPRSSVPGSIPTQHQNGNVDSTYDTLAPASKAVTVPGPKNGNHEPDNTYDVPSSCPAKNENNYDVLPRSPLLTTRSNHSPVSPEDSPQVLTTPKRSRRFIPQSPLACGPGTDSAHPTNEGFYPVPPPSQGGEGHYDVLPKRPVIEENGQPSQNVEGYYDMPSSRPVADVHVLVEAENQVLQNGQNGEEEPTPRDVFIDSVPVAEGTPKSKSDHPYSKVKRLVSSDGKEQKVTVMEDSEDELRDQYLPLADSTDFLTAGSSQASVTKDSTPITLV